MNSPRTRLIAVLVLLTIIAAPFGAGCASGIPLEEGELTDVAGLLMPSIERPLGPGTVEFELDPFGGAARVIYRVDNGMTLTGEIPFSSLFDDGTEAVAEGDAAAQNGAPSGAGS